jgi:hypothetical protein
MPPSCHFQKNWADSALVEDETRLSLATLLHQLIPEDFYDDDGPIGRAFDRIGTISMDRRRPAVPGGPMAAR